MGRMFITVRGEERAISYMVDASGPGASVGVDWSFTDQGPHLLKLTDEEEDEICQKIVAHWDDNAIQGDD